MSSVVTESALDAMNFYINDGTVMPHDHKFNDSLNFGADKSKRNVGFFDARVQRMIIRFARITMIPKKKGKKMFTRNKPKIQKKSKAAQKLVILADFQIKFCADFNLYPRRLRFFNSA
uniref:Uncharacterized protein n=1 Tax=Trichogramma kaykai TaxID=54128 RepID=A0ABD2W6B7_9HYME